MEIKEVKNTQNLIHLLENIEESNVVFDVFDTIVHRNIHPQDVKKITSKRLVERLGLDCTPKEIYDLRFNIERELCLLNDSDGFDLEFNLEVFAERLFEKISNIYNLNTISIEEFIELVIDIEISVEQSVLYVDPNIVNTIRSLHARGINVYICSDFYIPGKHLKTILKPFGFNSCIKNYYVSADYKLTKRSGKLYKILLNEGITNAIMIGDNEHSDCKMALENGWQAYHLDRAKFHQKYEQYQGEFESKSIIELKISQILTTSKERMFPEMAMTSFYFIHKLYNELTKEGYKDVLFLAREGQLIEELFNSYQKNYLGLKSPAIKSHYFKVSRRSTFLPSLTVLSEENFHNLFRQYVNISLSDFLQSLGFNNDYIEEIAKTCGIDKDLREKDFPSSFAFEKLITNINFINTYEERRQTQKNNFNAYINSLGLKDTSKIAIIDVGWKGTIQDNIFKILDEKTKINGYYFGLVKPSENDIKNPKKGILFDISKWHDFYGLFNENRSLYEVIFAANHGSTICYKKDENDKIEAILEDFSSEQEFYDTQISPIISDIKTSFSEICSNLSLKFVSSSLIWKLTVENHMRMVYSPTQQELDWFINIYHIENFGVFEKNIFNQSQMNIFSKVKNYLVYRKKPEVFLKDVVWPIAELHKHGLTIIGYRYGKKNIRHYTNILK